MPNLDTLETLLAEFGMALPAPVAAVRETRRAIFGHIAARPAERFYDDVLEGRITAANAGKRVDEATTGLVMHEKATQLAREAQPALDKREARVLRESGDALIEGMRPAFDAAVADLAAFVDLGLINATADVVLEREDGSSLWKRCKAARATIRSARKVNFSYLRVVGYFEEPEVAWYVAEVREDRLSEAKAAAGGHDNDLSRLLEMGFKIRLNTRAESDGVMAAMRDRRGAVEAEKQARQRAEDEAAKAKYRSRWADKLPVRK